MPVRPYRFDIHQRTNRLRVKKSVSPTNEKNEREREKWEQHHFTVLGIRPFMDMYRDGNNNETHPNDSKKKI